MAWLILRMTTKIFSNSIDSISAFPFSLKKRRCSKPNDEPEGKDSDSELKGGKRLKRTPKGKI